MDGFEVYTSSRNIFRKLSKKRIDKTGMQHTGSKFQTTEWDWAFMQTKDIILGADSYRDYYVTSYINKRIEQGISTAAEKITVHGNPKKANKYIRENFANNGKIFTIGQDKYIVDIGDSLIEIESNHNTIDFRIHGTFERIDEAKALILKEFEEIVVYIRWVYSAHGESASIPLDSTLCPIDEMYPWLGNETLNDYYTRYQESNASILILIGPPGTGKTSLIRGYLTASQSSAIVTYDEKILSGDTLFSDFVDSESNTLVIEDADMFLASRADGNTMMHKFLNVGAGLVSVKGKKIIFSTNLPSIKDMDPALLRPGRCFDIMSFRSLTKAEAITVSQKLNIPFKTDDRDEYTIAEIFNAVNNPASYKKTGFGFL